jgi:hypothetical protein
MPECLRLPNAKSVQLGAGIVPRKVKLIVDGLSLPHFQITMAFNKKYAGLPDLVSL